MAPDRSNNCRKYKNQLYCFKIYRVLSSFTICILLCSVIVSSEAAQNDRFPAKLASNCNPDKNSNCNKSPLANRMPREEQKPKPSESLMALINWLFGPPAAVQTAHATENSTRDLEGHIGKPEPKITSSIVPGDEKGLRVQNSEVLAKSNSTVDNDEKPVPQVGEKSKRNIEITDIQASIGTELNPSRLHGDSSQDNLKNNLDLVEKFDQSVQRRLQPQKTPKRTSRSKREPYKPIKVPYTTTNSNDLKSNILRQRQLLVNPYEQQMVALQQQQAAAAAAAILQQQQMESFINGNRYPVLDDYDEREDDEDSDEDDSDEFDDFTRFGPPMIEHHHMYLRDGLPPQVAVPPFQRKLGWGLKRRSVNDKNKQSERRKFEDGEANRGRTGGSKGGRRGGGKYRNPASFLTNGQWLLDDYDLNSEFHDRPQERKNGQNNIERPEMDEEEHYVKHNTKDSNEKVVVRGRGDMDDINKDLKVSPCKGSECQKPRQDSESSIMTDESTSEESTSDEPSSTAASAGGSSTDGSTASSASDGSSTSGGSSTSDGSSTSGGSSTSDGSSTTASGGPTTPADSDETTTAESESSSNGTSTTSGNSSTLDVSSTTEGSSTTAESTTNDTDSSSTTDGSTTTEQPKPKPPYKATLNCRCGTQSVRGGMTGNGTVVRFNVNPWLVAIMNGNSHLCSGSIINDRYVLTSKSCLKSASDDSLFVTAGLTSNSSTNYKVKKVYTNPNVNIALLQLNSVIKPSEIMRPVCLPIGKRYAGQYSTGNLVTFKRAAKNLQMVDTEVSLLGKGHSKCTGTGKGTICAGPPGTMRCGGDSGGVLMVYRGGYSYEQIGVVAGSVGCRTNGSPGIYTDIRKRTRWILNNTKDGNYCKSPQVTDEDLMSSTRVGDPYFEISDDFEDASESDEFDRRSKEEEADNHAVEVLDGSLEE